MRTKLAQVSMAKIPAPMKKHSLHQRGGGVQGGVGVSVDATACTAPRTRHARPPHMPPLPAAARCTADAGSGARASESHHTAKRQVPSGRDEFCSWLAVCGSARTNQRGAASALGARVALPAVPLLPQLCCPSCPPAPASCAPQQLSRVAVRLRHRAAPPQQPLTIRKKTPNAAIHAVAMMPITKSKMWPQPQQRQVMHCGEQAGTAARVNAWGGGGGVGGGGGEALLSTGAACKQAAPRHHPPARTGSAKQGACQQCQRRGQAAGGGRRGVPPPHSPPPAA